jgi:hypothetical protein
MNEKKNTPQNINAAQPKTNHRSAQESKLERRQFAFPMEKQREILKQYEERGLRFGRASHGKPLSVMQRTQTQKLHIMNPTEHFPDGTQGRYFIDLGDWQFNTTIIYFVVDRTDGRQSALAKIEYNYDDNAQRASFRAFDYKGLQITPSSYSLGRVKKMLLNKQPELLVQMELDEKDTRSRDAIDPLDGDIAAPHNAPKQPVPSPYGSEVKAERIKQLIKSRAANARTKSHNRSR